MLRYSPGFSLASEVSSRASTATYKDINGNRQIAAINQKRDAHYIGGIQTTLLEGTRTNHFLNSAAPATQTSASLATGTYTLWMEGTGSIAVAGTTATITGAGSASAGVNVTFTVTVAGTVTYTVTGTPTLAQAENGSFATSYIPTTGAPVVRATDIYNVPFSNQMIEQTFYVQFFDLGTTKSAGSRILQVGGAADPRFLISEAAGDTLRSFNNAQTSPNVATGGVLNISKEVRGVVRATGVTFLGISISAGAETVSADSPAPTIAPYSAALLNINSADTAGNTPGFIALQSLKIIPGTRSLLEMRAA